MGRSPRGGDCRELDRERAHVTGIGATGTVDFTGDIPEQVHAVHPDGVDVVLHFAGDPAPLAAAVKPGGAFVSTIAQSAEQAGSPHAAFTSVFATPTTDTLQRLADHHAQQRIHVTIQHNYRLEDLAEAFAHFTAGTLGKLIITID